MKKIIFIIMITLICVLASCASKPQPGVIKPTDLPSIQSNLGGSSAKLENNVNQIDNALVNIRHHTEVAVAGENPELIEYGTRITGETSKIEEANNSNKTIVGEIDSSSKALTKVNTEMNQLQAKVSTLENENTRIQNDAVKNIYSYLGVVFAIGLATVIAGAALAFFLNPKTGLAVSLLGLIGLSVAAAATYYLKVIAIVSMIGVGGIVIGVIAYIVYAAVREKKQNKVLVSTTEETVELVETMKQSLPEEKKIEIFGTDTTPGIAHDIIKSDASKKIISNIRAKKKSPAVKLGDDGIEEVKKV